MRTGHDTVGEFYVFDPSRVHNVEVLFSHSDKWFDFKDKGDADILDRVEREWANRSSQNGADTSFPALFQSVRSHSDFEGVDMGQSVQDRIGRGFEAAHFIGSALFDTPFQIEMVGEPEAPSVDHSCFQSAFHFDVYQHPKHVDIDEEAMTMQHRGRTYPVYVMQRRIGRWEDINKTYRGGYGVWTEPDCFWDIDTFDPFDRLDAIFSDKFHLRFGGDSNHQFSVTAANQELVPNKTGTDGINSVDLS